MTSKNRVIYIILGLYFNGWKTIKLRLLVKKVTEQMEISD